MAKTKKIKVILPEKKEQENILDEVNSIELQANKLEQKAKKWVEANNVFERRILKSTHQTRSFRSRHPTLGAEVTLRAKPPRLPVINKLPTT